jgi:hypothetical protein
MALPPVFFPAFLLSAAKTAGGRSKNLEAVFTVSRGGGALF